MFTDCGCAGARTDSGASSAAGISASVAMSAAIAELTGGSGDAGGGSVLTKSAALPGAGDFAAADPVVVRVAAPLAGLVSGCERSDEVRLAATDGVGVSAPAVDLAADSIVPAGRLSDDPGFATAADGAPESAEDLSVAGLLVAVGASEAGLAPMMLEPDSGFSWTGLSVALLSSAALDSEFDLLVPRAGFFELSDLVAIDAVPLRWLGVPGLSAGFSTNFPTRRFSIGRRSHPEYRQCRTRLRSRARWV